MRESGYHRSRLAQRARRPAFLGSLLALLVLCASCGSTTTNKPTSTLPAVSGTASTATIPGANLPALPGIHVPAGFRATLYASGLKAPRFMAAGPNGVLFVADRVSGGIVALADPSHTGAATQKTIVVSGLNDPTSVIYDNSMLYVGERTQVTRLTLGSDLQVTARRIVIANLPASGQHTTRTVLLTGDGKLLVAIGSTCNVCIESDTHRAAIWQYDADGSNGKLYVKGLRNAVGLATNPWTGEIWATNNGRDYLGDDSPPETLNILRADADFGWPRCHAGTIVDPDFGRPSGCSGVAAPAVKMQAHSAPLGLAFYQSGSFPASYHGVFVAFHGSWNRTVRTGYKVIFVPLDSHGAVAGQPQDFATGWLHADESVAGRPVGLTTDAQGALYISDDQSGAIYRIAYFG